MTDRGRRSRIAAVALPTLLVFALFRVADGLHLVPADRETAAFLGPVLALLAGGSALVVQAFTGRAAAPRRLRRLLLAWSAPALALVGLYGAFVYPVDPRSDRVGSVVVAWPLSGCTGIDTDCAGQGPRDCLRGLGWEVDLIEDCWGEGRVQTVRLGLLLSTLLASGGFGGLVGLLAVARSSRRESEPGPLRFFLCYRRADSGPFVDRLHPALEARFGDENVFRDIEAIRLGEDFRQAVQRAISRCDVFLPLIGPGWLDAAGDDGDRRLDRSDDPVRIEIETAIARGLRIVPVLVGDARMPRRDQMPAGLQELSDRAGARITGDPANPADPTLVASIEALIRGLEEPDEGET